jgi:ABC-2 type transport system permease protein
VMPIIQLIILANAATFEAKNLKLFWVDKDQSSVSRQLLSKFQGSPYFVLSGSSFRTGDADEAMERDRADLIVEVPRGFERDFYREGKSDVQLVANAIDGVKGGLAVAYAQSVIMDLNRKLLQTEATAFASAPAVKAPRIQLTSAHWYNPNMDYKTFMVPGILALLVTMIGAFLSSMNIVREKELGTIEQLNVTPIKKYQFIVGKLLPFWVLALFDLALGLGVGLLLYDIPIEGSLWLVFGYSALYLLVVLGLGLFVSTVTETQQQAMFISWFILVVFILMSGLFTAIENMPNWAQQLTYLNPVRYFIEVLRMVMLKGAGFADVKIHFLITFGYALLVNGLAIWRYRKTV